MLAPIWALYLAKCGDRYFPQEIWHRERFNKWIVPVGSYRKQKEHLEFLDKRLLDILKFSSTTLLP